MQVSMQSDSFRAATMTLSRGTSVSAVSGLNGRKIERLRQPCTKAAMMAIHAPATDHATTVQASSCEKGMTRNPSNGTNDSSETLGHAARNANLVEFTRGKPHFRLQNCRAA